MIIIGGGSRPSRQGGPRKSKTMAGLIALFSGFIGGHKLYLGDTGGFVFYMFLLMMTFNMFFMPVTGILGVFEAFRLFGMSDQEFDSKYNGGYVQRGDPRLERRREEQMKRYETEDQSRGFSKPTPTQETQRQRANPFKSSGLAKYKDFDLDGAIEDFNKGLDIDPNDVALNFNIACAYSLSENKDLAFKHLAKAVSLGFNDYERILTHDDLAFVRIQPEFDTFKQSNYRVYTGGKKAPYSQSQSPTQTTVATSPVQEVEQVIEADENLLAQLNRLAELRDKGILSENEFQLEKKKLTRN